jgi:hypothetical protein
VAPAFDPGQGSGWTTILTEKGADLGDDEHDMRAAIDAADELGIVSKNRWYVLAETEEGYGLWVRQGWEDGAPFAMFGKDAEGFTKADGLLRKRTRQMRLFAQLPEILAWVVVIGAIAWVSALAVYVIAYTFDVFQHPQSSLVARIPIALGQLAQLAYAIWLAALGLMVTLWILRRVREDPPVV